MSERQPIFNAPGAVLAVLGTLLAVHAVRAALSDATDAWLVEMLAFIPERLGAAASALAGGRVAAVTQFVTHIFVHIDLMHLALNSGLFLAFGTAVERRIGAWRFLAFFLVCGVGAALLSLPFIPPDIGGIGASGAVSGLMGACLRFLFLPLMERDVDAFTGAVRPPLLTLSQALTDRRILIAHGVWAVINVLFAWTAGEILEKYYISWAGAPRGLLPRVSHHRPVRSRPAPFRVIPPCCCDCGPSLLR